MTARQLVLLRPATTPLRDALSLVADQWSTRLGFDVRVVDEPHINSGAYRIERKTRA